MLLVLGLKRQTGVSQVNEITTADAAMKLLQSDSAQNSGLSQSLAENGIGTNASLTLSLNLTLTASS